MQRGAAPRSYLEALAAVSALKWLLPRVGALVDGYLPPSPRPVVAAAVAAPVHLLAVVRPLMHRHRRPHVRAVRAAADGAAKDGHLHDRHPELRRPARHRLDDPGCQLAVAQAMQFVPRNQWCAGNGAGCLRRPWKQGRRRRRRVGTGHCSPGARLLTKQRQRRRQGPDGGRCSTLMPVIRIKIWSDVGRMRRACNLKKPAATRVGMGRQELRLKWIGTPRRGAGATSYTTRQALRSPRKPLKLGSREV